MSAIPNGADRPRNAFRSQCKFFAAGTCKREGCTFLHTSDAAGKTLDQRSDVAAMQLERRDDPKKPFRDHPRDRLRKDELRDPRDPRDRSTAAASAPAPAPSSDNSALLAELTDEVVASLPPAILQVVLEKLGTQPLETKEPPQRDFRRDPHPRDRERERERDYDRDVRVVPANAGRGGKGGAGGGGGEAARDTRYVICKNYTSGRGCERGLRCEFLHPAPTPSRPDTDSRPESRISEWCRYGKTCKNARCTMKH